MSLFGFGSLAAFWLALLVVPLVTFYFLKLKRPRIKVPSLVLWQRVMNDSRVNSPFQRFKRNILLWIQLLLLVLLVLAATQPFIRADTGKGANLPVIVDCSASMAARLRPGGPSRLDEARERVRTQIDGMVRGQRMALISAGATARRVIDFTDNKRKLHAALDSVHTLDVESNLEDALRMANAMGRAVQVKEVLLYSDGNVPQPSNIELPFVLTFDRIEPATANAGISSLRAVRSGSGEWRVFVGIDASAGHKGASTLTAMVDDAEVVREVVAPSVGAPERVVFVVPAGNPSRVSVKLQCGEFDAMSTDNAAYLDLPALRPASVHVPESMVVCRRAIAAMSDVELWPDPQGAIAPGDWYDVAISDVAQDGVEAQVSLTIGVLPTALTGLVTRISGSDRVVDWDRSDPLLQHVSLADIFLSGGTRFEVPNGAVACAERGWQTLVYGEEGPLMVRNDNGPNRRYALLVKLAQTTLPYRLALPVMLENLVQLALRRGGLSEAEALKTGVIAGLTGEPDAGCAISLPTGGTIQLRADENGRLPALPARQVGLYRCGSPVNRTLGVALLSPLESSLSSVEQIEFAEIAVAARQGSAKGQRALWPFIILAGLLLLLVEWAVFQRVRMAVERSGSMGARR